MGQMRIFNFIGDPLEVEVEQIYQTSVKIGFHVSHMKNNG